MELEEEEEGGGRRSISRKRSKLIKRSGRKKIKEDGGNGESKSTRGKGSKSSGR